MGAALSVLSLGAQALGGGLRLLGGIAGINSAKDQANYQAKVARNNMHIAQWNQSLAQQEGEVAATNEGLRARAGIGAITAGQAASGVDINTGSPVSVRSSAAEIGQLNSMTIKSDSARKVYGYGLQAQQYKAEKKLAQASKPTVLQSILGLGTGAIGSLGGIAQQGSEAFANGTLTPDMFGFGGGNSLDTTSVGSPLGESFTGLGV